MSWLIAWLHFVAAWIVYLMHVAACLIMAAFHGACAWGLVYVAQHYIPKSWPVVSLLTFGSAGLFACLGFVHFMRAIPMGGGDGSGRNSRWSNDDDLRGSGLSH